MKLNSSDRSTLARFFILSCPQGSGCGSFLWYMKFTKQEYDSLLFRGGVGVLGTEVSVVAGELFWGVDWKLSSKEMFIKPSFPLSFGPCVLEIRKLFHSIFLKIDFSGPASKRTNSPLVIQVGREDPVFHMGNCSIWVLPNVLSVFHLLFVLHVDLITEQF